MLAFLLAAALEFTARDAQFSFAQAASLVDRSTPRDIGKPGSQSKAVKCLCDAARLAGINMKRDCFQATTPYGEREFVNLYAEFPSDDRNAKWVVLLSHYDTKPGCDCPGANDGASTSGLLLGLSRVASSSVRRRCNVLMIWTDGEECVGKYGTNDGFWGSRRAAERIAAKGYDVQAVICLDMLGDRELAITIPANGSRELAKVAHRAAAKIGMPDLVKDLRESVLDDHVAFLERGYPAIDLIDFEYGPNNAYWHTPQDTMDKVSVESIFNSGRLVTEMLNILL